VNASIDCALSLEPDCPLYLPQGGIGYGWSRLRLEVKIE
jgi:hypothetical protein